MIQPAATIDEPLYMRIFHRMAKMIGQGALRPGDRVPSVRKLSRQEGVSISTVLQAYVQLEAQGFIEARPQSGFYVKARLWRPPAEPAMSKPSAKATPVSTSELTLNILKAVRDPRLVALGTAIPSPELLPLQQLNRMMAAIGRRDSSAGNSYDVPPGAPQLRMQVARLALDYGCLLSPEEIVTTTGCQEALNLCLRAVAQPGDTIAVESPTYYGILQIIGALGMKALEIPTHPRDGVSLDALEYALDRERIKACLFTPTFQNPLGCSMPEENRKRLVTMLGARGIPLIEDDIYGGIAFGPERPRAAKAYDTEGMVLLCDSFSKTLAPGYRVGWCAPGRYQKAVEHLKFTTSIASATLPALAIAEFLATGGYEHHLRKVRRVYAEQVRLMTEVIVQAFPDGTKVTRPQGGHVLWVEMPAKIDSMDLFHRALAARISIAPGILFSAKQKYRNCMRLNCGTPWGKPVEDALKTLGMLVTKQARQA
jgi:DNA-binding transcriptional MocR family regulator